MLYRKAFLVLLLTLAASAWPDSVGFTLRTGANLPIDPLAAVGTSSFNWGGGVTLAADYQPFGLPFFIQALTGFDLLSIRNLPGSSMGLLSGGSGAGIVLGLDSRLRLRLGADAGYALAAYNEIWSSSWFIMATGTLLFSLNPDFSIGAGASYKYYPSLYAGVGFFIAISFQEKIAKM